MAPGCSEGTVHPPYFLQTHEWHGRLPRCVLFPVVKGKKKRHLTDIVCVCVCKAVIRARSRPLCVKMRPPLRGSHSHMCFRERVAVSNDSPDSVSSGHVEWAGVVFTHTCTYARTHERTLLILLSLWGLSQTYCVTQPFFSKLTIITNF